MRVSQQGDHAVASEPAVEDRVLEGPHGPLRVRIYRPVEPSEAGLVWLHGGGFHAGSLDMPEADWVSTEFARRGIAVVSVDYRLAPTLADPGVPGAEPPAEGVHYPVPVDEAVHAFRWAVDSGIAEGPWALGGASAGGNIATGTALRLVHDGGMVPALVVLAYPTLLAVQPQPDATLRAALDAEPEADKFFAAAVARMYQNYLGAPLDTAPAEDLPVYAVPGLANVEQLRSFPPTIMINDEVDELRVSGEAFAASLRSAGVEVDASTEPGTQHGHLNRPAEAAASASLDRFAERINALVRPR